MTNPLNLSPGDTVVLLEDHEYGLTAGTEFTVTEVSEWFGLVDVWESSASLPQSWLARVD